MEPEYVNQTPSHDFPVVAARGDLCGGRGGLARSPDGSSKIQPPALLAKRAQAERAAQGVRVRSSNVIFAAGDQRRRIGAALSERSEGSLM